MATILRELYPPETQYRAATAFPQLLRTDGTNAPVSWLAYDAAITEYAFWELGALNYGASTPNVTVDIIWSAASATSGAVVWEASIMAGTPETDALNWETEAFGTAVSVTDTHLGTTAKRLMRATITLSGAALDAMASGDELILRIGRVGGNAADTMAGDAYLKKVLLSWSDT
ncbi:hypothetical protein ACFFMN_33945 [Planobispora siamensis]|uniref:Uncharacterized protein n=1 Tax=Planobispora siamensis TaxID=936338 RepID=A0A8J3SD49_9ACTN|nr:hypothetical protein [Planobispora siamensis]GIH91943.1 hypothetical protein Psi01_25730 [Planobispora siamensis]